MASAKVSSLFPPLKNLKKFNCSPLNGCNVISCQYKPLVEKLKLRKKERFVDKFLRRFSVKITETLKNSCNSQQNSTRVSGAPLLRKLGKLSMRETLIVTSAYAWRPTVRTLHVNRCQMPHFNTGYLCLTWYWTSMLWSIDSCQKRYPLTSVK